MALPPDIPSPEAAKRLDRDAKQQDVLLREVDDAYRQDQLSEFAKNHGTKVGGVVIAGLLVFGGYLLWSDRNEKGKEETSEEIVKSIDQLEAGNFTTATKDFTAIEKKGTPGEERQAQPEVPRLGQ